jgi:hypothetical protein
MDRKTKQIKDEWRWIRNHIAYPSFISTYKYYQALYSTKMEIKTSHWAHCFYSCFPTILPQHASAFPHDLWEWKMNPGGTPSRSYLSSPFATLLPLTCAISPFCTPLHLHYICHLVFNITPSLLNSLSQLLLPEQFFL